LGHWDTCRLSHCPRGALRRASRSRAAADPGPGKPWPPIIFVRRLLAGNDSTAIGLNPVGAISQAGNPGFGICADTACVCANLLPRRLRARGRSVRDHRCTVVQMHSHRLRRRFSKAVRRLRRWPYAQAPKKRGARPPATHSAYLRGPTSDSPGVPIDESDQSTGRRGDQSMRERVDRKCAVSGLLFRGRCRQG